MTDKTNRVAKLMAATSVLALALGMTAQAADQNQIKNGTTTTQIKGQSDQHKLSTGYLKHTTGSNQIKLDSVQHKGDSNQIKFDGVSGQHKHATPSTELNPQPEPPAPTAGGTPTPH